MDPSGRYPALLLKGLTQFYDIFARLFFPEKRFKRSLIAQAHLAPGQRVLDLGAGSGTLAIMIKKSQPEAHVVALDGDAEILMIAREKASQAKADIFLICGDVTALPYPAGSFDRKVTSLVMSLLSRTEKKRVVQDAYRVLRQEGELHIADFGPPHTPWGRWVAPLVGRFEPMAENLAGILPELMIEAGFEKIQEAARFATLFGTLSLLSGIKPAK